MEREYYWSKEKQRGLERRRYLGYIIDDVYYDTETYKKYFKRTDARRLVPMTDKTEVATPATPSVLEAKIAGEFPLYYAIAQQTGLLEDLIRNWGEDRANAILSLAFHGLTRRSMLPICMIPGRKTSSYPTNNALPGRKSLNCFVR